MLFKQHVEASQYMILLMPITSFAYFYKNRFVFCSLSHKSLFIAFRMSTNTFVAVSSLGGVTYFTFYSKIL